MQTRSIILVFVLLIALILKAETYEVLVLDIAGANDVLRIKEFEKDGEYSSLI